MKSRKELLKEIDELVIKRLDKAALHRERIGGRYIHGYEDALTEVRKIINERK